MLTLAANGSFASWRSCYRFLDVYLYACAVAIDNQYQTAVSVAVADTLRIHELAPVATLPADPQYQRRPGTTRYDATDCPVFPCRPAGLLPVSRVVRAEIHRRRAGPRDPPAWRRRYP